MEVFWSEDFRVSKKEKDEFRSFLNAISKRILQGRARYGKPEARKKYHTRLKMEVKAYSKTGNIEHLYNIANYCFLESIEPEHPKSGLNAFVNSVTRGKVKD